MEEICQLQYICYRQLAQWRQNLLHLFLLREFAHGAEHTVCILLQHEFEAGGEGRVSLQWGHGAEGPVKWCLGF